MIIRKRKNEYADYSDDLDDALKRVRIVQSPGEFLLGKELTQLNSKSEKNFVVEKTNKDSNVIVRFFAPSSENGIGIGIGGFSHQLTFSFSVNVSKFYPHSCPEVHFLPAQSPGLGTLDLATMRRQCCTRDQDQDQGWGWDENGNVCREGGCLLEPGTVTLLRDWSAICSLEMLIASLQEILRRAGKSKS